MAQDLLETATLSNSQQGIGLATAVLANKQTHKSFNNNKKHMNEKKQYAEEEDDDEASEEDENGYVSEHSSDDNNEAGNSGEEDGDDQEDDEDEEDEEVVNKPLTSTASFPQLTNVPAQQTTQQPVQQESAVAAAQNAATVSTNGSNEDLLSSFRSIFNMPKTEKLIEDFYCAYFGKMMYTGRMYISQNYVCFHSNILGFRVVLTVPFREIVSITKQNTIGFVPNAIEIRTVKGHAYFFGSLMYRDQTFAILTEVLKLHQRKARQQQLAHQTNASSAAIPISASNLSTSKSNLVTAASGPPSDDDDDNDDDEDVDSDATEYDEDNEDERANLENMSNNNAAVNDHDDDDDDSADNEETSNKPLLAALPAVAEKQPSPPKSNSVAPSPKVAPAQISQSPLPPLLTLSPQQAVAVPLGNNSNVNNVNNNADGNSKSPSTSASPIPGTPVKAKTTPADNNSQDSKKTNQENGGNNSGGQDNQNGGNNNNHNNAPNNSSGSGNGDNNQDGNNNNNNNNNEGASKKGGTSRKKSSKKKQTADESAAAATQPEEDDIAPWLSDNVTDPLQVPPMEGVFWSTASDKTYKPKEIFLTPLQCNLSTALKLLTSDDSELEKNYHNIRGDTDLTISAFQPGKNNIGKVREVKFVNTIKNKPVNIGPNKTRVLTTQRVLVLKGRKRIFNQFTMVSLDVPYGDCFKLQADIDIVEKSDNLCEMRGTLAVIFVKSVSFLFKGTIEEFAFSESSQSLKLWADQARQLAAKYAAEPPKKSVAALQPIIKDTRRRKSLKGASVTSPVSPVSAAVGDSGVATATAATVEPSVAASAYVPTDPFASTTSTTSSDVEFGPGGGGVLGIVMKIPGLLFENVQIPLWIVLLLLIAVLFFVLPQQYRLYNSVSRIESNLHHYKQQQFQFEQDMHALVMTIATNTSSPEAVKSKIDEWMKLKASNDPEKFAIHTLLVTTLKQLEAVSLKTSKMSSFYTTQAPQQTLNQQPNLSPNGDNSPFMYLQAMQASQSSMQYWFIILLVIALIVQRLFVKAN